MEDIYRFGQACKGEEASLVEFKTGQEIRDEIALANPSYDGIQNLKRKGTSSNGAEPGYVKAESARRRTEKGT